MSAGNHCRSDPVQVESTKRLAWQHSRYVVNRFLLHFIAAIAQLGERQTEDLKVPGSIPGLGIPCQGWGLSAAACAEQQTSAPCGKSGARLGRHVSASDEEMVHGSGNLASEDKASCNG